MIDLFKIAVSIGMTNNVSQVVRTIQGDLSGLRKTVDVTAGSLATMRLAAGGTVRALGPGGFLGTTGKLVRAGEDVNRQLAQMAASGHASAAVAAGGLLAARTVPPDDDVARTAAPARARRGAGAFGLGASDIGALARGTGIAGGFAWSGRRDAAMLPAAMNGAAAAVPIGGGMPGGRAAMVFAPMAGPAAEGIAAPARGAASGLPVSIRKIIDFPAAGAARAARSWARDGHGTTAWHGLAQALGPLTDRMRALGKWALASPARAPIPGAARGGAAAAGGEAATGLATLAGPAGLAALAAGIDMLANKAAHWPGSDSGDGHGDPRAMPSHQARRRRDGGPWQRPHGILWDDYPVQDRGGRHDAVPVHVVNAHDIGNAAGHAVNKGIGAPAQHAPSLPTPGAILFPPGPAPAMP